LEELNVPRCHHSLAPLIEEPTDLAGRFYWALNPASAYLVCSICGRVGWHTKHAGKLSWLPPEAAERMKVKAEEFRRWQEDRRPKPAAQ
jgi:hypothetical protein